MNTIIFITSFLFILTNFGNHLANAQQLQTTINQQASPQPSSSPLIKQPEKFDKFYGIPAAFGDLNSDKRTDIVVIVEDGTGIDIYYQKEDESNFYSRGWCKSHEPIAQVYLAEIYNNARLNFLVLLISEQNGEKVYQLKALLYDNNKTLGSSKPDSSATYSIANAAALKSSDTSSLNNTASEITNSSLTSRPKINVKNANNSSESFALPLLSERIGDCEFKNLGVTLKSQPLLFDFDGDLQIDIMGLDEKGNVAVWKSPSNVQEEMVKDDSSRWINISKNYFGQMHSNSFIDINQDQVADIVFSSDNNIAYAYADPSYIFRSHEFAPLEKNGHFYGQSSLVDINADGIIEHLLPVCSDGTCRIILLTRVGDKLQNETIFNFKSSLQSDQNYILEEIKFAKNYTFPISLRPADLDGDGYTDFLTIAKDKNKKSKVLYLKNIENNEIKDVNKPKRRTFQVIEIETDLPAGHEVKLVLPFDINEDGKMDLLFGSSRNSDKPDDMMITAQMNTQMVDACFMKVIVTNGHSEPDNRWTMTSGGNSAIGPFVCFELNQNDGDLMKGCAGQLSQSSHFALQLPYTIFGLGQTAHFVENLNVTITGFSSMGKIRSGTFGQIVPDAQIIIIPNDRDNPANWGYKLFLSPMSRLALRTLAALAVICLVLLVIIAILHRKESKEDAVEHEEYRRHWPESR